MEFLLIPLVIIIGCLVIKNLCIIFNGKKIVHDYSSKAKLRCTSETSVFSTPPGLICMLYITENGLEILVTLDLKAKTTMTYLIDYSKIDKIYYDKKIQIERTFFKNKTICVPDYIIVNYIADDNSLHQLRFLQTKIDKNLNNLYLFNQINSDPGFIGLINARKQRESYVNTYTKENKNICENQTVLTKIMRCPNCGASINKGTALCDFCGTKF